MKKILLITVFFICCCQNVFATVHIAQKDNLYGLEENGKIIVVPQYTSILKISDNIFLVGNRLKLGVIDKTNKAIIPIEYPSVYPLVYENADTKTSSIYFAIGKIIDKNNVNKINYGIADFRGKIIVPMKYRKIARLDENLFIFTNNANKSALASSSGRILTPFKYKGFRKFSSDILIGAMDDKVKLVYADGSVSFRSYDEIRAELIYKSENPPVLDKVNSYLIFVKKNKQAIADFSGKIVIPFKYERIKKIAAKKYVVSKNDKFGVIDEKMHYILDLKCDFINWNPRIKAYKIVAQNKTGLLSSSGNVIAEPIYDEIFYMGEEDYFMASMDDKRYKIYRDGKKVEIAN